MFSLLFFSQTSHSLRSQQALDGCDPNSAGSSRGLGGVPEGARAVSAYYRQPSPRVGPATFHDPGIGSPHTMKRPIHTHGSTHTYPRDNIDRERSIRAYLSLWRSGKIRPSDSDPAIFALTWVCRV